MSSSTQKKLNLNNLLGSVDTKNSLNEKVKNRNYKQFIKRIKANSTEKLEFSLIKNQNNSNYQNQNNMLGNLSNINNINNNTSALNSNNPNFSGQIQNLNFQTMNFSANNKEKVNERYSSTNFHTQGNGILDKKIIEKRAKSGLATSLTNLEIMRKNQESRATCSNTDTSKIPNSNESNPSSSSNKIDIKISFNYSKNNSLNNNNNKNKNSIHNNNLNSLPYQSNASNSISNNNTTTTNNHITHNNYANYYLRYKNLSSSKPNNVNLNGLNSINNNNYSNVNTSSNNYEHMNTYSHLNTSINNKTSILNSSYMHNNHKPTILHESNFNNIKPDLSSKNKNLINVNNSANFNFHSINNSNFLKKKINKINNIHSNESEITSDDLKNLNNTVSKQNINISKSVNSSNKGALYDKKPQSESHFYQNNQIISVNKNIENKPVITNYYAKGKGNNNSFAFNENMLDKINRGINSLSLSKKVNENTFDINRSQILRKFKMIRFLSFFKYFSKCLIHIIPIRF